MQIAYQLDPMTVQKIKKSFLIGTAGFAVGAIGVLMQDKNVLAFLASHPIVAVAVGSYVPVVVNSINQWRKGQPQE